VNAAGSLRHKHVVVWPIPAGDRVVDPQAIICILFGVYVAANSVAPYTRSGLRSDGEGSEGATDALFEVDDRDVLQS
jgi:hypothetical protein